MSISDKINEIRQKPEHIRLRYVWAAVAVSMFFIVIVWLFSLQETFKNSAPKLDTEDSIKNQWQEYKENMPSIEEFMKNNPQNNINSEIAPTNESRTGTDFQNPTP
jgi:hypothetical protein